MNKASEFVFVILIFNLITMPVFAQEKKQSVDQKQQEELLIAVKTRNSKDVKDLVDTGLNVNISEAGPWNRSLLHLAAGPSKNPMSSHLIAQILLNAGANPNAKMRSGLTPLHEAARTGSTEFTALLLKNDAEVNPRVQIKNCLDPDYDSNGCTPLDLAIKEDQKGVAKLLRRFGGKTGKELDAIRRK